LSSLFPAVTRNSAPSLIEILAQAAQGGDVHRKARYREAVEALEARIANDDGHPHDPGCGGDDVPRHADLPHLAAGRRVRCRVL